MTILQYNDTSHQANQPTVQSTLVPLDGTKHFFHDTHSATTLDDLFRPIHDILLFRNHPILSDSPATTDIYLGSRLASHDRLESKVEGQCVEERLFQGERTRLVYFVSRSFSRQGGREGTYKLESLLGRIPRHRRSVVRYRSTVAEYA